MTDEADRLSRPATIWWSFVATLIAITTITTITIRVPIPATTGYFNLGDIFVILSGLLLGPKGGLLVGAVGSGLADAIGYPQFIFATAVTKGAEGLVVGLLVGSSADTSPKRALFAALAGGVVMVAGYFIFEAMIYPALGQYVPLLQVTNLGEAIVELVPNTIQAILGAVGGVALWTKTRGFAVVRSMNSPAKPAEE